MCGSPANCWPRGCRPWSRSRSPGPPLSWWGLLAANERYHTPLTTLLPLRHDARLRRLVELLRAPQAVTVQIAADVPAFTGAEQWRLCPVRSGGGVLLDLGYHFVDLILNALGQPDSMETMLEWRPGLRVESTAEIRLVYRDRPAVVHAVLRADARLRKRCEITVNGAAADLSRPPATPLCGVQLGTLLAEGFVVRSDASWHRLLHEQLGVAGLIDRLYATAEHTVAVPGTVW
jgi:predicted dehydrogenase